MIKINKNTLDIELVRGDTGTFSFYLIDHNTKKSLLHDGDHVDFKIKKVSGDGILLEKTVESFPNGLVTIPLPPEETIELEADNYIYSLVFVRKDGNVDTLNPNRPYSNFTVKEKI